MISSSANHTPTFKKICYYNPSLPTCNLPSKVPATTYSQITSYTDFVTFIQDITSSDCRAMTVNGEILFNSYVEKPLREAILDKSIRQMIYENANYSLLAKMNCKNSDYIMNIYAFPDTESFRYEIIYNAQTKEYTSTIWMSEGYFQKFGDNF